MTRPRYLKSQDERNLTISTGKTLLISCLKSMSCKGWFQLELFNEVCKIKSFALPLDLEMPTGYKKRA
jgi:hypothetical protein